MTDTGLSPVLQAVIDEAMEYCKELGYNNFDDALKFIRANNKTTEEQNANNKQRTKQTCPMPKSSA